MEPKPSASLCIGIQELDYNLATMTVPVSGSQMALSGHNSSLMLLGNLPSGSLEAELTFSYIK